MMVMTTLIAWGPKRFPRVRQPPSAIQTFVEHLGELVRLRCTHDHLTIDQERGRATNKRVRCARRLVRE